MDLSAMWAGAYDVIAVVGVIMGVFGIPSLTVLYRRALNREMRFSPALAFAHTYFSNFIAPVHERLVSGDELKVDGRVIDHVFIQMPSALAEVSVDRLRIARLEIEQLREEIRDVPIQTPAGKRTILVRCGGPSSIAFDVPRILHSLEPIIADHLGESAAVAPKKWERIEQREFRAFCEHLKRMIRRHGFQQRIKVFACPVEALTPDTDDLESVDTPRWRDRALRALRRRGPHRAQA